MNLTAQQKRTIERVVNAFETGNADGDYGKISIFHDGPHDLPQITYGRSQTTEYGNLRLLVQRYVAAGGMYSSALAAYFGDVGSIPLTNDVTFRKLLRDAGRRDPVMHRVQDELFETRYFVPAREWAEQHRLKLPLSLLVVYDSFIHSGGMLWVIRAAFPERVPSQGGDERAWTTAYVKARQAFLANHSRPVVRNTVYRTKCLQREIQRDNWHLAQLPIDPHGVSVHA